MWPVQLADRVHGTDNETGNRESGQRRMLWRPVFAQITSGITGLPPVTFNLLDAVGNSGSRNCYLSWLSFLKHQHRRS
jgi:hypothetical protein